MLRDAGKSEWVVMVVSSLIFGLLHATNVLSGQEVLTVAVTVVFAFGFGICMYLTLRVTGNLIWPMLLHGLYDPTLFLATGGIDEVHSGPQSELLTLAGPSNLVFLLIAVVGLVFVRGRVRRSPDPA
jgi:membrane protease YdiL (CAAX protease family)